MDDKEKEALYVEIKDTYGIRSQESKLVEKCIELGAAILRYHGRRATINSIIEEAADVEIIIEQLHRFYQVVGFGEKFQEIKKVKLANIKRQLEEEKRIRH